MGLNVSKLIKSIGCWNCLFWVSNKMSNEGTCMRGPESYPKRRVDFCGKHHMFQEVAELEPDEDNNVLGKDASNSEKLTRKDM